MENAVEEREQTRHSAEANEPVPARKLPKRGNGESDQEKPQYPLTRPVGDGLDGVGAQIIGERPPNEKRKRDKTQ